MILFLSFLLDGAPVPPFPPESGGAPPLFVFFFWLACALIIGLAVYFIGDAGLRFERIEREAKPDAEIERLIDAAGRKPWQVRETVDSEVDSL